MRSIARKVLGVVAAVVLVAGAVIGIGRAVYERRLDADVDALLAARNRAAPVVVTEDDLARLPKPVQRWLRWAQVAGTAIPATVHLEQTGRFRQSETGGWMPFTAEETYTTDPPGFVWKTSMQMFPLLSIIGRDQYANGHGSIEMRALGIVPVADAAGPEMDQGALLRYLNETIWFPAAAVSPFITWDAIDATSARATMSYGEVTASATFVFDEQGRPVDMLAERQELASGQLQTWSTPFTAYGEFENIRVPVAGTALWRREGGDFPYIELQVTDITYDLQSERT